MGVNQKTRVINQTLYNALMQDTIIIILNIICFPLKNISRKQVRKFIFFFFSFVMILVILLGCGLVVFLILLVYLNQKRKKMHTLIPSEEIELEDILFQQSRKMVLVSFFLLHTCIHVNTEC